MIVLTFALCWLPFWICTIYCYTTKSTPVCHGYKLNFVTRFLEFSNSAFNPCIYSSCNERFRQGAKEIWQRFHCSVRCRQPEVSPANAESLSVRGLISRHLEKREDSGNEVGSPLQLRIKLWIESSVVTTRTIRSSPRLVC